MSRYTEEQQEEYKQFFEICRKKPTNCFECKHFVICHDLDDIGVEGSWKPE